MSVIKLSDIVVYLYGVLFPSKLIIKFHCHLICELQTVVHKLGLVH